jgi:hypothetical protein
LSETKIFTRIRANFQRDLFIETHGEK